VSDGQPVHATRTSRALGAVAVAVLVAGGALLYIGTRGHGQRQFVEHFGTPTTIPGGGFAVGRMHITGGPRPDDDQQLQGVIFVYRDGDRSLVMQAGVDVTGSFRINLPVGTYQLVAHPDLTGIAPFRSQGFRIEAGRTTAVDLVDIAT
jgi:hypothetical protein